MLCVAIPVPDTSVRGRLGAARPVNSLDGNLDLHRGNPTERHCHKYWLKRARQQASPTLVSSFSSPIMAAAVSVGNVSHFALAGAHNFAAMSAAQPIHIATVNM